MKTLILGVTGMLGHQIYLKFKESGKFSSVKGTIKEKKELLKNYKFFNLADIYDNIDFSKNGFQLIKDIILKYKPDVVVNCVVIKPNNETREKYFLINSFLSHYLAKLLNLSKGRLIQISTDGVFKGNKGNYSESDVSNADDLYGQSKFFGEVYYDNHLTIRTSVFGHELFGKGELVEWFISAPKSVKGYENVYFSGVSTNSLSEIIIKLIKFKASGIINIGSKKKISKYDLLCLIDREYGLKKKITPKKVKQKVDRSLNVNKMIKFDIYPPSYTKMVKKMREEYLEREIYYYGDANKK